jgi:NAD(P)-dependent dehydrogenase (short-subunit alcohol dehydrogenase family)
MHINGATALVTGPNRGLGKRLVEQLVERGAAKVYGAARRPETVTTPGSPPSIRTSPTRRQSQPRSPTT